ncbi:hypothetical protein FMN50_03740 [Rhodobacterales bacterium]|nr:hypothetical protein FMN50_03740 [Rhodobacterales bacterium]
MTQVASNLRRGAENLLKNCAGLRSGQSLLVIAEDPACGMYGQGLAEAVADVARDLGCDVTLTVLPFDPGQAGNSDDILASMEPHDQTVFLHRVGDQLRFSSVLAEKRPVVCYTLDREMLASGFGQTEHGAMVNLKDLVNRALAGAKDIHVTCPLGTDVRGGGAGFPDTGSDTSVIRFPQSVFTPVPGSGYRGQVAQAGFLVGTGSNYYDPYGVELRDTLFITFDGERITGFDGGAEDVATARKHYRHVADQFGIDPWVMHSWHAGIHPGCAFGQSAGASLERWSGGAFGNPRLLHFHTCGNYAPGEISLNIVDPTVLIDGVPVWEGGSFFPDRLAGGKELLDRYEMLADLFRAPAREIGLSANGRLQFRSEPASG